MFWGSLFHLFFTPLSFLSNGSFLLKRLFLISPPPPPPSPPPFLSLSPLSLTHIQFGTRPPIYTHHIHTRLKHVEGELDSIAVKSGGQVDLNVVHENGLLQAQIKEMLDDEVLQQLLTAILVTNHNGDNVLCKLELRQLEYKFRNMPGIIFHKDRFQAFCENDEGEMTIADITKIVHNLRDPTTPKENCVFEYDTKALVHKKKQGGEDEGASPTTEADIIAGEDEEARPATAADI